MYKLTTVAVILGLVTAFASTASHASVWNGPRDDQRPESPSSDPDCSELMGFMRTPKAAEILGLVAQRIAIIPVCEDRTVARKNDYGSLFVNGNAELLRNPIARNPGLIGALRSQNYDQHDVVSVRFGSGGTIILYVHQRDMR
ncbi:hypothetical protein [Devosia sp. 2618]|uniref:hypothetical protein n=1 Tax=Devosia sp. 2618 TaxID=3156454 RepID=UPI00339653A2